MGAIDIRCGEPCGMCEPDSVFWGKIGSNNHYGKRTKDLADCSPFSLDLETFDWDLKQCQNARAKSTI